MGNERVAISWKEIKAGDPLPELKKKPGVSQLVKYAAGSGDFNPLHYDPKSSPARATGSIVVHGRFKYASLGELVSNWLDHKGRIKKISCQYFGMDYPDAEIRCKGTVLRKWEEGGEKLAELRVWTENEEGKRTTPGLAVVVFL
jgi:acyl dehydratase